MARGLSINFNLSTQLCNRLDSVSSSAGLASFFNDFSLHLFRIVIVQLKSQCFCCPIRILHLQHLHPHPNRLTQFHLSLCMRVCLLLWFGSRNRGARVAEWFDCAIRLPSMPCRCFGWARLLSHTQSEFKRLPALFVRIEQTKNDPSPRIFFKFKSWWISASPSFAWLWSNAIDEMHFIRTRVFDL